MDEQIREYLVMAVSATAISVVLLLITVSLLDYREYGPYVSVAIGMVAGLAILLVRRRRLFIAFEKNLCEKLRDVSSILSFMAMPPATAVVVMKLAYSDLNADDLVVISAILVIISMIVQAVFWKYAQDVGYLTFADIIMLVISLILMNVASILSFDRASGIMIVVGIVTAILPVLMMYDWQWTVKIVLIGPRQHQRQRRGRLR